MLARLTIRGLNSLIGALSCVTLLCYCLWSNDLRACAMARFSWRQGGDQGDSSGLADRYAIESELGAGGMATVYLAEDLKHRRKAAVKVLRPGLSASLFAERFLREMERIDPSQKPR